VAAFLAFIGYGTRIALSKDAAPLDVQAQGQGSAECGERRVSVAVDPKIAAVVRQLVEDLPENKCASVGVRTASSSVIAEDVARQAGRGLGGTLPDIWIADSSVWFEKVAATAEGKERLGDGSVSSVATSPIVIAMNKGKAQSLGWPTAQPKWSDLIPKSDKIKLAFTDIPNNASGLASVPTIASGGAGATFLELSRKFMLPVYDNRAPVALVANGEVDAVASSEQEVFLQSQGSQDVVAGYDSTLGLLDYPMAQITPLGEEPDEEVSQVLADLAEATTSENGRAALAAAGFRGSDGTTKGLEDVAGIDSSQKPGAVVTLSPEAAAVVENWPALSQRVNLLVLFDQSGSMGELLPDGVTTRAAGGQAPLVPLFGAGAPDDQIGLWGFTNLIGNGDYEELSPIKQMNFVDDDGVRHQQEILAAIPNLQPIEGGATPLYDTVSAAYPQMVKNYVPGRFNAIVLITDGRNEDPGSPRLNELLNQLRRQYDGTRPVIILSIGYGPEVDQESLKKISEATGGAHFDSISAEEMGDIMTNRDVPGVGRGD
jgi:hypothetical protein